jgi:protein-tyrosine phosphatase
MENLIYSHQVSLIVNMTINVLFVCYGNICRSPLAEFIFKDMVQKKGLQRKVYVESAGTSGEHIGDPVDRRSAAVLAKHGISCAGKTSRKLFLSDFSDFDYILGMDEMNMEDMHRMCPDPGNCIVRPLLDYADGGYVDDPYFTLDFDKAYSDIEAGCRGLMREIEKKLV